MPGGNIRYRLHYDTPLGKGCRRAGSCFLSMPFDLDFNREVAEAMCKGFGAGTHWIEDEEGEKVWPLENTP